MWKQMWCESIISTNASEQTGQIFPGTELCITENANLCFRHPAFRNLHENAERFLPCSHSSAVSPKPVTLDILPTLQCHSELCLAHATLGSVCQCVTSDPRTMEALSATSTKSVKSHCSSIFYPHQQLHRSLVCPIAPKHKQQGSGDLILWVNTDTWSLINPVLSVSLIESFSQIHFGVKRWWNRNPMERPARSVFAFVQLRGSRFGKVDTERYDDRAIIYSVRQSLCQLHKFD